MISFPNCKINLGLNVIRKRQDGYHDIETVFYPLPLIDVLEIIPDDRLNTVDNESKKNAAKFLTTGLPINGAAGKNLCVKAYELLQRDFPKLPSVQIFLHKTIPIGAGLGGGSADGSFALRLLNKKFQLKLSTERLLDYSLQLGSDCPFFILNRTCYASGRGEFLQTIELDLQAYSFVIVHPGTHISTAWAFQQLTPSPPVKSVRQIVEQPISTWKNELINDFEMAVCHHHPELSAIKSRLYDAGAVYASLSGSGSCFYGLFPKNHLPSISFSGPMQVIYIK
ncbi:MAG: 4-(cytidine 5'-diphospho)-2-C-methyl-D-erythritol kinase [Chitinophagaceae bacterium]|nr:4-(cytidine 5'-diphospho)-2-C-methyl-D-erythritol kinase [Chitinophagaceae bacterium]